MPGAVPFWDHTAPTVASEQRYPEAGQASLPRCPEDGLWAVGESTEQSVSTDLSACLLREDAVCLQAEGGAREPAHVQRG